MRQADNLLEIFQNSFLHYLPKNCGVSIETIDNPGWSLKIKLDKRQFEAQEFEKINSQRFENDWVTCWVEQGCFFGIGGPINLLEIIKIYLSWISDHTINNLTDENIEKLQTWYFSHCDGDWEHSYGVEIKTKESPEWSVQINLIGTELEDVSFQPITVESNQTKALQCIVDNGIFIGKGGSESLSEILEIFNTLSMKYSLSIIQEPKSMNQMLHLLEEIKIKLPLKEYGVIVSYIEDHKYALAFEILCYQLLEQEIEITESFYQKIAHFGKSIQLGPSVWLTLKKLIKENHD